MFDLNLEHGLSTPIGHLDSSAILSFQWGHFHDLSNLYCIATSLAKLISDTNNSYIVITNNEVDNFHNHHLYPSQWTNLSNMGTPPHPGTPHNSLLVITSQHSHFDLLHLTHTFATWIDSLHYPPPPSPLTRSLSLLASWNANPP
jgi:hypothetical protein